MSKKHRKYQIEESVDVELEPSEAAFFAKLTHDAEADLEAARVNFRWTKYHVDLVKAAAAEIGIPYQTYIKQVVYKQVIQDLRSHYTHGAPGYGISSFPVPVPFIPGLSGYAIPSHQATGQVHFGSLHVTADAPTQAPPAEQKYLLDAMQPLKKGLA
jgi:predicted DNA binding CopG/RHH family protein